MTVLSGMDGLSATIRRDPPGIAKGIPNAGLALLVRFVLRRGDRDRAQFQCATIGRIDIGHVHVDRSGGALGVRRVARFQHDHGVADARFDVKGRRSELLPLEFDGTKGIAHQVPELQVSVNIGPYTAMPCRTYSSVVVMAPPCAA